MKKFANWVASQKVWVNILLSILTAGIWLIIWLIAGHISKNNKLTEEEKKEKRDFAKYQFEELLGAIVLGIIFLIAMYFINR